MHVAGRQSYYHSSNVNAIWHDDSFKFLTISTGNYLSPECLVTQSVCHVWMTFIVSIL